MPITESQVLDALRHVIDPDLHRDIVTLGFIKDVSIDDDEVSFKVQLTTPACPVREELKSQCEENVLAIPGVQGVHVTMTAQVRERAPKVDDILPKVRHIIAVASGKGGVGKSTCTVNLAVALAKTGAKVGLMDADVYGPCIPLMVGASKEQPFTKGDKIIPIVRYGVVMMSIGFLLAEGQAVLWRGPMVAGTVKQLLGDVDWGELDYLLVDLPPGTGDAPMSLAQLAPLTGVVIVSTPHVIASEIAGKAVQLFRRLNTPILGVIENMGSMTDKATGVVTKMFHGTSGESLAEELKVPYLGSIPFNPEVSQDSDRGVPTVVARPQTDAAEAFTEIAGRLAQQTSIFAMTRPTE